MIVEIQAAPHGGTELIAHGVGPLAVRRAFATLRDYARGSGLVARRGISPGRRRRSSSARRRRSVAGRLERQPARVLAPYRAVAPRDDLRLRVRARHDAVWMSSRTSERARARERASADPGAGGGRRRRSGSAAGSRGSGRPATRMRWPANASAPAATNATKKPHWMPTVPPSPLTSGRSKTR